ncbi:MAG: hypothetical protein IT360_25035 [Gemmatimonadaceae bacterium]|nr:hypothetical protein [Gemmatimonadaceae bacterium]
MSASVELVYFEGCPRAQDARRRVGEAMRHAGIPGVWKEWDTLDPATPAQYQRFGSPTVLVAGRDVSGGDDVGSGMRCVVGGGPSVETILCALRAAPDGDIL